MNLIGFGIVCISFILLNFFPNVVTYVLLGIGLLLFVSITDENVFVDYIIANSDRALVRVRHYIGFLPIVLVSKFLTLGKGNLLFPYKEEYFVVDTTSSGEKIPLVDEIDTMTMKVHNQKVSRSEYKALLKEQRKIYSNNILPKEFMDRAYSVGSINFKHKKRRLIAAIVLASITAVLLFDPDPMVWAIVAIYEVVFIPMALLWIAPYRDAKILQAAYDRVMQQGD